MDEMKIIVENTLTLIWPLINQSQNQLSFKEKKTHSIIIDQIVN